MNILFAASEGEPFVKTGGLADIIGSLPWEIASLVNEKHQGKVCCVLPKYSSIPTSQFPLERLPGRFLVPVGDSFEEGIVWVYKKNGGRTVPVYFIENKKYFDRKGLYHEGGKDYPDNAERFIYFSRAVLECAKFIRFKPSVIHCHDWQTGLLPALLKQHYSSDPYFIQTKTVFTIHNLAYQGVFPQETLKLAGLPLGAFVAEKLEYFGSLSTLKAGIVYADKVTTVSPNYAQEIVTIPDMGKGLTGVIKNRAKDFSGILNGISYAEWNPEKDSALVQNYSLKSKDLLDEKKKCKKDLQLAFGLPPEENVPLIGVVSRLDRQKGFHILASLLEKISQEKIRCQWVILGVGDHQIENELSVLSIQYPALFKVHFDFNPALAHKIYAGSDLFFMPSEFEPCGLSQMIALRYGAVPMVSPRGGLLDTIRDWESRSLEGTGFIAKDVSVASFYELLLKALDVYKIFNVWEKLVRNGMAQDFSWGPRAQSYLELYESCFTFRKKMLKKIKPLVDKKMIFWTFLVSLLFSLLFILRSEGVKVLNLNRDALVLEVYSKTNLEVPDYFQIGEKLKLFPEIKTVVTTSAEESVKKLENDPNLNLDLMWINQKKNEVNASNSILPWSYACSLNKINQDQFQALIKKIEELKLENNSSPVWEVHYDKERWSYIENLSRTVRWINFIIFTGSAGLCFALARSLAQGFRKRGEEDSGIKKYAWFFFISILCALGVHAILWFAYLFAFEPPNGGFVFGKFMPLEIIYAFIILIVTHHFKDVVSEEA